MSQYPTAQHTNVRPTQWIELKQLIYLVYIYTIISTDISTASIQFIGSALHLYVVQLVIATLCAPCAIMGTEFCSF